MHHTQRGPSGPWFEWQVIPACSCHRFPSHMDALVALWESSRGALAPWLCFGENGTSRELNLTRLFCLPSERALMRWTPKRGLRSEAFCGWEFAASPKWIGNVCNPCLHLNECVFSLKGRPVKAFLQSQTPVNSPPITDSLYPLQGKCHSIDSTLFLPCVLLGRFSNALL